MIGVLAYGSLITDPGLELEAITVGRTEGIYTPFSVEFARKSNKRCGAPTLVPVDEGGGPVRAVIFEVNATPTEAADIVYRREVNAIGSGKSYPNPSKVGPNTTLVEQFVGLAGFEVVLSTRIAGNIFPLSADILADLAIESAKQLADGRDGITYLKNVLACGIVTPLSPSYEASILRKTGAADLTSALEVIRDQANRY